MVESKMASVVTGKSSESKTSSSGSGSTLKVSGAKNGSYLVDKLLTASVRTASSLLVDPPNPSVDHSGIATGASISERGGASISEKSAPKRETSTKIPAAILKLSKSIPAEDQKSIAIKKTSRSIGSDSSTRYAKVKPRETLIGARKSKKGDDDSSPDRTLSSGSNVFYQSTSSLTASSRKIPSLIVDPANMPRIRPRLSISDTISGRERGKKSTDENVRRTRSALLKGLTAAISVLVTISILITVLWLTLSRSRSDDDHTPAVSTTTKIR